MCQRVKRLQILSSRPKLPKVFSQVQASGWLAMITITVLILLLIMLLPSVLNTLEALAYLMQTTLFL